MGPPTILEGSQLGEAHRLLLETKDKILSRKAAFSIKKEENQDVCKRF